MGWLEASEGGPGHQAEGQSSSSSFPPQQSGGSGSGSGTGGGGGGGGAVAVGLYLVIYSPTRAMLEVGAFDPSASISLVLYHT